MMNHGEPMVHKLIPWVKGVNYQVIRMVVSMRLVCMVIHVSWFIADAEELRLMITVRPTYESMNS